ncbi:hypothetical protein E2C01_011610 [Portunus trituberculatus]|uniref:Uncharacterized protein n=1 Tax=Portunus trituberculatus TaxID=210409 RepID=A0A5B7DCB8_PORTR|nr:hypothetical protein [Portunus trituberculatus]
MAATPSCPDVRRGDAVSIVTFEVLSSAGRAVSLLQTDKGRPLPAWASTSAIPLSPKSTESKASELR